MKKTDKNAIGLAAPQIGESRKLFIIAPGPEEVDDGRLCYPIFNAKLHFPSTDKIKMWEECLSVPNKVGIIERFSEVHLSYQDERAKDRKLIAKGFWAGVIQHENDHLDGKLFIDHARPKDLFDRAYFDANMGTLYPLGHLPEDFNTSVTFC